MTLIEEVASFAREFINIPAARTPDRKATIRKAIRSLTGRKIGDSCGTCYIEAVIEIVNRTNMASSKYELKRGVVLQVFGDPSRVVTNNTITDEIGDWYMANHPEKMVYFSRYPKPGAPVIPKDVTIVMPKAPPQKVEPPADERTISDKVQEKADQRNAGKDTKKTKR